MALALVAAFLISGGPAQALLPASPAAEEGAAPVETQEIDQAADAQADERIAGRINGVFSEIPEFTDLRATVRDGVVTLRGTIADTADIARAEGIASRVDGVATVRSEIERDTSVEGGLDALGALSERVSGWIAFLPLIGLAAIVAIAIALLGQMLAGLTSLWRRVTPNAFLAELAASAIRMVFIILGLVVALDMLGAGALLGAVLGGAGVVGIALGFAMRDTIENYVASIMLSLRQPFRANDHVLIDDLEGRVIRLTSRATILMTLDGNHLRIPNAQVFKAVILNYTRNPQRRFDFELGIDADDDPRAAMELASETMQTLPFVLADPEPAARVAAVGDSNIVITMLAWIDQRESDWFKSRSLAIAAVKEALEEAGFALPEPIYRLRFDGRTDPLPIGTAATVTQSADDAEARSRSELPKPSGPTDAANDVRPESEIARMVERERREDGEQGNDLLDAGRPTE
ncbi:mechanosensitive ion channel domain-containing protein [Qipengyuania sp. CAU 1752]